MTQIIRRAILALVLAAGLSPAFAQAPPPVPALPDAERRTTYSLTASVCSCSVGMQLYGDSTDYTNWLTVWVNGVQVAQSGNWTISSPSGQLANLSRPITDAVLTFTAAQTGTVQIVGAQRPRRLSEYAESRGVAARDLNQTLNSVEAQLRELWDRQVRTVQAPPGETLAVLPILASRQNTGACFDSNGYLTSCVSVPSSSFVAGAGISFTGSNPTTIAANIQAGTGINITGTNPMIISAAPATFGPACNVVQLASISVSITSGTATLNVVGGTFVPGDVGKVIAVPGAGATVSSVAGTLNTTILTYNSATQVVLANNAGTALAAVAKTITYGTDDTTAFQTALNSTTTNNVDFSGVSIGCMITNTLTLTSTKYVYGASFKTKLFFRQLASGVAGKPAFTVGVGSLRSTFARFGLDYDLGGGITAGSSAISINIAATGVVFDAIEIDGNLGTATFPNRAIDNLADESKLLNSYIHGFTSYVVTGASKASHVLIQGNRVVNCGKNSIAAGVITFLSSGQTGFMGDLRIIGNSIDCSNLAAADQTTGIYVYGGDTLRTNSYNNIVIADNTVIGTAFSTTTLSAGVLVTQAYNVAITGNSIKWMGEGIGTGAVVNLTVTGNSLYGNGTYSIESNGDTAVTISGNTAMSDGYSTFGITAENMINGVISGNAVDGTSSAVGYNGISVIGVNNSTGSSTFRVAITGNTVTLPAGATGKAITVQCNVGATSCIDFVISANTLDSVSVGAGSYGVMINHGAGTTMGNFQIGPNHSKQDTGVFIDTGVTGICYITGRNNSTTPITNNGSASSCT